MKKLITLILACVSLIGYAENKCYIEDFYISAGEEKEIAIVVENDIEFTTFACDIYLPGGLEVYQENGEYIFDYNPERITRSHGYPYAVLQKDGAIRVYGESTSNANYKGNSGALMYFTVMAGDTFSGTHYIELKKIDLVSNYNNVAEDNWLENSTCTVNPPVLVQSMEINEEKEYKEFYMRLGYYDTKTLTVTVLPEDAADKSVTWTSSNPEIATVDQTGFIQALLPGKTVITATTNDGSNLTDSRTVVVGTEVGVEEVVITGVVYVENGSIIAPVDAEIFNVNGVVVGRENLPQGVYMVVVGNECVKVMVK